VEDSFQPTFHARYTNFTALCFGCHQLHDNGYSTLTAKVSNQRSQETTAKRKREKTLNQRKVPTYSVGQTVRPLYYNSDCLQLLTHSAGQTILASHSSLRSLLSACTKLRTAGLLTGGGKVMCLLACHLWGDRMVANGPDGRGVFPCVSHFTSSPNSSYSIAQQ